MYLCFPTRGKARKDTNKYLIYNMFPFKIYRFLYLYKCTAGAQKFTFLKNF